MINYLKRDIIAKSVNSIGLGYADAHMGPKLGLYLENCERRIVRNKV